MSTLLLPLLLATAPAEEVTWFPVSAGLRLSAAISTRGQPSLGAELFAAAVFGRPSPGPLPFANQGLTFGPGLFGAFGGSPWTACDWCLTRIALGPFARLAWVFGDRVAKQGSTIPDYAAWLHVGPLLVRESLPDAPLMPGGARTTGGARVEVGFTAIGWTVALFKLVGLIAEEGSTEVGVVTLPLFGLAFVNTVSVFWEWNGPAISMSGHRFGATIGGSL